MLFNRTIVTLTLILFALSGASAQTLIPVDSLALFDANGKRIGAVQSHVSEESHVFFQVDGVFITLELEAGEFGGDARGQQSSSASRSPWLNFRVASKR